MRIELKLFLILLVGAMLLAGCAQQQPQGGAPSGQPPGGNQTPQSNQTPTKEQLCAQFGGTVTTQLCCGSVDDFPNTCLMGACGCSPDNSHEVKVCDCGEGKCWDSGKNKCVATQTTTPPENNMSATTVGMDQIYRFDSVKSYEYKITASGTTMNLKTTITSDTVNGTATWLQQTDMTVQGTAVTSKMWLDKATYKCLKTMTIMNYRGQNIEETGQCPTEGPNSGSGTGTTTPQMTFVGTESVTVPAGTFTATKYSLEQVYYWSASSVPVPVKIAYGDGTMTMELVSYAS